MTCQNRDEIDKYRVRKTRAYRHQITPVLGRVFHTRGSATATKEATIGKRFGYVRTSTADQINGIDVQIDAILKHDPEVDRRDIFIEQVSGGLHHTKRPKLNALLAQIEDGDVIHAHKIDRVGRSTLDLLTIVEEIKTTGARFVSVADGIDTGTGIVAEMFLSVLSCVASYERAQIRDRTISSLRVLKERGVQLGRPRKLTPALIRQVHTLHHDPALSVNEVCASLGISRSSYYQALKAPAGDAIDILKTPR